MKTQNARMRSLVVAILLSGSAALKVDTFTRKNSSAEAVNRTGLGCGHPREQEMMQELDRIMVAHGGMAEGHSGECPNMQVALNGLASQVGVKTICETGFNGGHSSLRWLLYSNAYVNAFDLGQHGYARPAAAYLQKEFPNRLTPHWGDSHVTLKQFAASYPTSKCDLVFVDGDHTYEGALADIGDFKNMATPTTAVIVIDDVHCTSPWCAAPTAAWNQAISQGMLMETSRGNEAGARGRTHDARGWAVGKYL